MKNIKNHLKVLSALSIASSDTREDTLISIIVRTVFVNEKVEIKELSQRIKEEFDFTPYEAELVPILDKLVEQTRLFRDKEYIWLADEEKDNLKKQETTLGDEDQSRFTNFKNFITDDLELDIPVNKIKILWKIFLKYIYNSFFEYGHDALKTLHPHIENGNSDTYEDVLQVALVEIRKTDSSLTDVFKEIVERFPDFASEKDLEFLNDLAQKTLSFTSLGIQPELANDTIDHDLVDWVLYLDTNVLYSLLGLHAHPENQACIALVNLIRSNTDYIKIKLRYSELTLKELGAKKRDFDLLDDKMTDSSIRALLRTDKLDGFSRKFYEELLNDRFGTIHPGKAIDLSQRTLKASAIEIGRNRKRLEALGENYIDSRIGDYMQFVEERNRIKLDFSDARGLQYNPTYRSERQVRHDVSLREIIIDSRSPKEGEDISMNNVKFFGVTLDGVLIAYDMSKIKDYNDGQSFPVFFKPSYLLNKLIKILPIQTTDYKKAFIKAITTRGFHRNTQKSEDILKIVNYLKSKGISDEKVIYNIISEDIFLEKFRENSKKSNFNTGEFIESELNREFKEKEDALKKAQEDLEETVEKNIKVEGVNQALISKKESLESEVGQYKNALEKLSKRVKKLENTTIPIGQEGFNFEAAEEKEKNRKLLNQMKEQTVNDITLHKGRELKKWQYKVWWNLFWVVPLVVTGFLLIIPNPYLHIATADESGNQDNTLGIVLGIISFLLNLLFFRIFWNRYYNEQEKLAKMERIEIPETLASRMRNLDDN